MPALVDSYVTIPSVCTQQTSPREALHQGNYLLLKFAWLFTIGQAVILGYVRPF